MDSFYDKLKDLLNEYSEENVSGTPDFVLANYLFDCLTVFNRTVNLRDEWKCRCNSDKELSETNCDSCESCKK